MVTADHGPAVSGAHNTIVTTRAGKDLVSSLVSGLLTIGPRFGGALDDAATMFTDASDNGTDPEQFVKDMRKANKVRRYNAYGKGGAQQHSYASLFNMCVGFS